MGVKQGIIHSMQRELYVKARREGGREGGREGLPTWLSNME